MFGKLFGAKPTVRREEDQVWTTASACREGLQAGIEQRLAERRSVMLVCLTNAAFETWADALALRGPVHCRDLFGREALRAALARAGTLIIALSGSLPADAAPLSVPLDILVYGRNAARSDDDALLRFADQLGEAASITFHVSLDDALLAPFAGNIRPLLAQLGMQENEALANPMITRAIRNCQKA